MKNRKGKTKNSGLVYSTEHGKMCPGCSRPVSQCSCKQQQSLPSDGIVRLMRESKGRKGKGVTLITGIPLEPAALKKLAKTLKQKCGSGGSIKNRVIEIQGEQRDVLERELTALGYVVKRSGG
jgi:translation initiation factor 1